MSRAIFLYPSKVLVYYSFSRQKQYLVKPCSNQVCNECDKKSGCCDNSWSIEQARVWVISCSFLLFTSVVKILKSLFVLRLFRVQTARKRDVLWTLGSLTAKQKIRKAKQFQLLCWKKRIYIFMTEATKKNGNCSIYQRPVRGPCLLWHFYWLKIIADTFDLCSSMPKTGDLLILYTRCVFQSTSLCCMFYTHGAQLATAIMKFLQL